MRKAKLSIVIPCYNEGENIPLLLEKYGQAIQRDDIEVVLVDNGSTDTTRELLKILGAKYLFLKVVTVPLNQGYGFGILSGLKEAGGEYLGWTHGDLQTSAADVIEALELIEKLGNPQNIYVKGARRDRPLLDRFFSWGMALFETFLLGTVVYEINAQPNIFHRSFLELWRDPPYDFSLDLYALYLGKKAGLRFLRFPVVFSKRAHGQSKWNTGLLGRWKFIKRTVEFSWVLKKRLRRSQSS